MERERKSLRGGEEEGRARARELGKEEGKSGWENDSASQQNF